MRLNPFILQLSKLDPNKLIRFECPYVSRKLEEYSIPYQNNKGVGDFCCYRGIYEDLAIAPSYETSTVQSVIDKCSDALGAIFKAYKGGLYQSSGHSVLWCSEYGTASNLYISHIEDTPEIVLIHTYEEPYNNYNSDISENDIFSNMGLDQHAFSYSIDNGKTWENVHAIEPVYFYDYIDLGYVKDDEIYIKGYLIDELLQWVLPDIKARDEITQIVLRSYQGG